MSVLEKVFGVPKVTCLCATKGRYELLRSAVSYFLLQDYPNKELLIFNNHPESIELSSFLKEQQNIRIVNAGEFSSITEVYNAALTYVDASTEFVAIWDDDDIYFPWHLSTAMKYLVKGTHHAWQPREQLHIDKNYKHYPKINAIRNHCEGSMVVKYSTLSSVGFGPASNADEHGQQHPHPRWCERINELGGVIHSEKDENSYAYFWGDENREKPWYVHLTNGGFEGNTQNNDTGDRKLLYPGPTYYDFISRNLYLKKYDEEYTAEEKEAVVTRLNSYDWSFFEERKLFTFWEGEKPYFIEKCLESMEKNSNCIFEVWNTEKLKQTYSDIPEEYDSLCVEFKSDYARQRVLYEQGGMWLDADMFVVGDLYESIMKYTWWYDQVQPLENPGAVSVNICAMACRPKSQVFKKALESVNAVIPLHIGWGDLLNTPTKYAIRESACRGLVKYIPETVISLKFVQNSKGGFSELYSSTEMSLDEIVLPDTAVVTLHSSQIRHEQKDIMPKGYLLQRLIDKYCPLKTTLPESIMRVSENIEVYGEPDVACNYRGFYIITCPSFAAAIAGNACEPSDEELRFIAQYCCANNKADVVVDVGAHHGTWSLPLSKVFKHIHSFEAFHENKKTLDRNILLNNINNIHSRNVALGEVDAKVFVGPHSEANSGCVVTRNSGDVSVTQRKLDSFDLGHIAFLKIDVEGSELNVLKGAKKLIQNNKPLICVEINELSEINFGIQQTSLLDYLDHLGYKKVFEWGCNNYFAIDSQEKPLL